MNTPARNSWRSGMERQFDDRLADRRVRETWRALRWNSAERLRDHAQSVAAWMRADGLEQVEVLGFAADGCAAHGGWRMPLCWLPRSARLTLVAPAGPGSILADYRKEPLGLVMYSDSTPEGGVEAQLVACPPNRLSAGRVRGRIVLFDGEPDGAAVRQARLAGALGFVTDFVPDHKGIRTATDMADAVPYCNMLLPPWRVPDRERGFGFAISPTSGQRLRRLLSAGPVRVHAVVDAALQAGELPVITGLLPGRTSQEILVTAHVDEPGANDNASGVMLALGIGRMLAAHRRRGWQPERGVRFFFSVETRALMAFLNTQPRFFRRCILGLNLDMLGAEQATSGATLKIAFNPPPLPDPALPWLLHGLKRFPGLRWKLGQDCGDNAMGDPRVGIPTTFLVQAPDRTYHTSLDTPAAVSRTTLRTMGRWLGGHLGSLCSAGPQEIRRMACVSFKFSTQRLGDLAQRASHQCPGDEAAFMAHHVAQERRRLKALLSFLPAEKALPWEHVVAAAPPRLEAGGLGKNEALGAYVADLAERLGAHQVAQAEASRKATEGGGLAGSALRRAASGVAAAGSWEARAATLVPLKTFSGFLSAESLSWEQGRQLSRVAEGRFGWGAPWWLQWALGWSNGKRTLAEIANQLRYEGRGVPCERLVRVFRLLEHHGFIGWRPYLREAHLVWVLRRVGVRPGMLLMTHSALSAFGYFEAGASTVVTALRRVLGPEGTLAMPTHTVSHLGQPAYDAARTPSTVGTVTEYFRKLEGVRRSLHPSHSVAACGPLAGSLLAGHDGSLAPLAREGFWGKFVEHDGWVLMMAPIKKNTLLHAAELWSGMKLPGMVMAGRRDRRRGWPVVPCAPWHNNWFDLAYRHLFRHSRVAECSLGDGTIYLMRARHVVEAGLRVFRRDPLAALKQNCSCPFCDGVRSLNGDDSG